MNNESFSTDTIYAVYLFARTIVFWRTGRVLYTVEKLTSRVMVSRLPQKCPLSENTYENTRTLHRVTRRTRSSSFDRTVSFGMQRIKTKG